MYLPGAKFEEIYALYLFDRELRNLYIRYILEIENNIKSVLARVFSKKYGHDNYLKVSNFDISVKKWEKKTSAQKSEKFQILYQSYSMRLRDNCQKIIR